MKTFKITFEGRYKDQLPITERLTQWVPAANPAAAVLALYDAFDVLVVHDIDEVTEFKTAEYLRDNPRDFPEVHREDGDEDTPNEAIGEERGPHRGVG